LGDAHKALELYEQAMLIRRETGERRGEADAMWNYALVLNLLDDRVRAIARAEAALEIYEATESPAVGEVSARLAKWKAEHDS
jgi:tetratricopeptide (TPR) repeat protein